MTNQTDCRVYDNKYSSINLNGIILAPPQKKANVTGWENNDWPDQESNLGPLNL